MKYMGIDFGSKRIGIAVSDDGGTMAFPHSIQDNTPKAVRELGSLIQSLGVKKIICGLSIDRAGKANSIDESAKVFIQHLHEITDVPAVFEWEGYSSGLARSVTRAGAPRGTIARKVAKTKTERVDAHAAMVILQSYLDKINHTH